MKEVKLVFCHTPKNKEALMDIVDALTFHEQEALISINALIDREESHRCKRFVEDCVTFEFNDYQRPVSNCVNYHRLMRKAREIRGKYEDLLRGERYPGLGEILTLLCNCDGKELHERGFESLSEWLEERNNLRGELRRDLDKLIEEFGFMEFQKLGCYNHVTKTITLYIDYFYDGYKYDIEGILSTLAHEIFHAYHAHLIDMNRSGGARSEFLSKRHKDVILKESLASWFEHYYNYRQGIERIAHRIEQSWRRYSQHIYPYAGALFISDDQHFKRIVDDSVISFDEGYRSLRHI